MGNLSKMVHKLRGHYEINPSYPALRYAELGSLDNLFSNIHYKFIDHFEEIAINFGGSPREHFHLELSQLSLSLLNHPHYIILQ